MGQILCPHCGQAVQVADGATPVGQWGNPQGWWGTVPPNPTTLLQPTQFPLVPGPGVTFTYDWATNTFKVEPPPSYAPLQGAEGEQEKPLATGGVIEPSNVPILVSECHPEHDLLTVPKGARVWPMGACTEPLEDPSV